MRLRFWVPFVLLASLATAASDSLEFSAYLHTGDREHFALKDLATGQTSAWLQSGDSFAGYTVGAFDPKAETLTVAKGGQMSLLPLKTAKVQAAGVLGDPTTDLATQLEAARRGLTTLRLRYRDASPVIKAQTQKIAELERQLAGEKAKN